MRTLKKGDQVHVIGNNSGHGVPIGTKGRILNVQAGCSNIMLEGFTNWWIAATDFKPVARTRKEIAEEVNNLKKEIKAKQDEIENYEIAAIWMEENNTEEFDEMKFKIYRVLETIKNTNDLGKATDLISEIIK